MKIRVLSCADREFAEAVDYYNGERPGLGFEFAEEVKVRSVAFAPSRKHGRSILAVAIMHLKRDPVTWRERAAE